MLLTGNRLGRLKVGVQAVYGVLKEAEHRSTFYIPYWNIPITRYIVPRQRKFHADLEVINDCLDGLIARAKQTRQADDVEALQARDYSKARSEPAHSGACGCIMAHICQLCHHAKPYSSEAVLQVTDPSLLRFLVDMRDADLSDKQLRDDLMTMLIAGHETTAAVLTWTLFALMSNPDVEAKMLSEIDSVLGDKTPGTSSIIETSRVCSRAHKSGRFHAGT